MRGRTPAVSLAVLAVLAIVGTAATAALATAPGKRGQIVFRRYIDVQKTTSAIFTIRPNGTKAQQVTHPAAGVDDRRPDWAPNGKNIAFERKLPCPAGGPKNGMNNTCDLAFMVGRDGAGLKSIAPCGFDASAPFPGNCVGEDDPAWSPDGSRIAFQYNLVDHAYVGSLGVDGGIWIVTAKGTGLHQVTQRTPGTFWDFGVQWSPDGGKLAFVRTDLATDAEAIFTVNVDGSGEFQVTPWTLNGGDRTDWSPNGDWILFRVQAHGSSNLYKIHPDGTGLRNLTKQGPGGYQYLSASFSPDGTKIATARTPGSGPEGAADLSVMNADGSHPRPVTKTRLWESAADWGTRSK